MKCKKLKIIINNLGEFEKDVNDFCLGKKVISVQIRKGNENVIEQGGHFAYIIYEEEII